MVDTPHKNIISIFKDRISMLSPKEKKQLLRIYKKRVKVLNVGTRHVCPKCGTTARKIRVALTPEQTSICY